MSRLPIRARLTIAFAVAMALLLAATGVFVHRRLESDLDANLDQTLRSRAADVAALAATGRTPPAGEETFARVLSGPDEVLSAGRFRRALREEVIFDRGPLGRTDDDLRVLARPLGDGRPAAGRPAGGGRVVVVGVSRDEREETLASLRNVLLLGGPAALLLASLAGYGLATAALRPIGALRRRAAEISRLDAQRRLPVPDARDEVADLARTLNAMLERLHGSMEREREFVAAAGHELRTPLALLQAELELALREGRTPDELRAAVASAAEESERLSRLADDLLVLARADEGRLPVRPERLDVCELLRATAQRFAARAQRGGREIRVETPQTSGPAKTFVVADRLRVEQALGNLIDNSLRHGAGPVLLTAEPGGRLHVRDAGEGFPGELLPTVFERFVRGDPARGRGGTGLGLSIVAAVARAHGGRAGAANHPDGGADVWIELPASSPSHPASVDIRANPIPEPGGST